MGTLYIVATPIGNLSDLSFRACDILLHVDAIACEDTRRAGLLLKHIKELYQGAPDTRPLLIRYYDQVELQQIPGVISLLKNDKNVALISDAGTPLISDPGFKLVRAALQEGIKVESIPGPSAITSSLVVSGLPTDKFAFFGYLPHKPGNRTKMLEAIKAMLEISAFTVVLFEAPHKIKKSLLTMQEVFGDITIVLTRELTKVHEEVQSNTISGFLQKFEKVDPRGEYVILFNTKEQ